MICLRSGVVILVLVPTFCFADNVGEERVDTRSFDSGFEATLSRVKVPSKTGSHRQSKLHFKDTSLDRRSEPQTSDTAANDWDYTVKAPDGGKVLNPEGVSLAYKVVRFESNINRLAHTPEIGIASVYYAPGIAEDPSRLYVYGNGTPRYGYDVIGLPPSKLKSVDYKLLMDRLHVSANIRINLVEIFGRILMTPDLDVSLDLYSYLHDIYDALRRKEVRTTELLRTIESIKNKQEEEQYLAIFTAISKSNAKKRVIYAAQVWVSHLLQGEVHFGSLLRQSGGSSHPLKLYNNISPDQLMSINLHLRFTAASQKLAPFYVVDNLGRLWGSVVGSLLDRTLNVTLPLVASIIQHVPLYRFQPEADEALKFLVDIFNEDREDMRFLTETEFSVQELQCPYHIVRRVLANIVIKYIADPQVNYAALFSSHHFVPPEGLYEENRYITMFKITGHSEMDYPRLFSTIQPGEYPDDVIDARNLLVQAIDNKDIDMDYALNGFVLHDYTEPIHLMIAIVDRIRRRSVIPNHLRNSLASINSHIKLKYAVTQRERRSQMQFADLKIIFDGFLSLSDNISLLARNVLDTLLAQPVIWGDVIEEFAVHKNGRPRYIARKILQLTLEKHLVPDEDTQTIHKLSDKLDKNGEPHSCECNKSAFSSETNSSYTELPPTTGYYNHDEQRSEIIESVTNSSNIDNVNMESLIEILPINSKVEDKAIQLINFLKNPRLKHIMGSSFDIEHYPTRGDLLKAILEKVSTTQEIIQADKNLADAVEYYLNQITLHGLGSETWTHKVIDMEDAFQAINYDVIHDENKHKSISIIKQYLASNTENLQHLHNFPFSTRGELLKGLFQRALDDPTISATVKQAFDDLDTYIMTEGPGAEPVQHSAETDRQQRGNDHTRK